MSLVAAVPFCYDMTKCLKRCLKLWTVCDTQCDKNQFRKFSLYCTKDCKINKVKWHLNQWLMMYLTSTLWCWYFVCWHCDNFVAVISRCVVLDYIISTDVSNILSLLMKKAPLSSHPPLRCNVHYLMHTAPEIQTVHLQFCAALYCVCFSLYDDQSCHYWLFLS